MAVMTNNAEGGTNGATVLSTDTGSGDPWTTVNPGAIDSILQYTNVAVMHGSLAYRLATRATSAQTLMEWDNGGLGLTAVFHRAYIMLDSVPTSSTQLIVTATHSGLLGTGRFLIPSGTMTPRIQTPGSATAYTFANAMTVGSWYRVELSLSCNGTTTVTWQARLYAGDNAVPIEDSGGVSVLCSGAVANLDRIDFGHTGAIANTPTTTGFQYFDDLLAFAATWPGPSIAQTRPYANVTVSGV